MKTTNFSVAHYNVYVEAVEEFDAMDEKQLNGYSVFYTVSKISRPMSNGYMPAPVFRSGKLRDKGRLFETPETALEFGRIEGRKTAVSLS